MGVLEAARAARITIPDDLAVTGWDDIPAARHLAPPLTTVRQPMLELGRRAAELLRDRITTHRTEPLARAPADRDGRSLELRMQQAPRRRRGMTRRRSSWAAVAALAMTFALAACGRDDEGRRRRVPAARRPRRPRSISRPPAARSSVWAMGTEGENLEVLAEDFMAEQPGRHGRGDGGPVGRRSRSDRRTPSPAGEVPDVSLIGTTWMGEFASVGGLDPTPANIDRRPSSRAPGTRRSSTG